MKKRKIVLIICGLLLVIIPYFINIISIYRILSIAIGIILLDISVINYKKTNMFLLFYLPIILLLITYSLDYIKTFALNLKPIYVFENKINDNVSIYNSFLYRIYKCDDEYILDSNYEKSFACNTSSLENIDANKILNEPEESYKKFKNKFIKVTGKISRIEGTNKIELREYSLVDNSINGYVKFNDTFKLVANLNGEDVSNYKIYDYITIVGYLDSYKNNELSLIDIKIEDNDLYANYNINVIEKNKCNKDLEEYSDYLYTKCIENIYLDYNVDKYELSYALKDKKINLEDFLNTATKEKKEEKDVYKFANFSILSCQKDKYILLSNKEKVDISICEE